MPKFKFKFPANYKPAKFYSDGDIAEVSEESAKQFTEEGIGSVVDGKESKVENTEAPTVGTSNPEKKETKK